MAELVHLHIENAIPELEQMERLGLFSRDEIKLIIKKRKDCEYTLRRRKKNKDDIMKYIKYEVGLLSMIGKRRKRLQCNYNKQEIDHVIATRINRLFKTVILRYQDDVKLWLSQIEFCKRMKLHRSISSLFPRMLQIHNSNPALWIMAAKWEMEENNSPENARQLLQRALRHHVKCQHLWLEYFRMELMYADMLRKRKEVLGIQHIKEPEIENEDAILKGSVAIIVYKNATLDVHDVCFALSFLSICQQFDFTEEHINHIFQDVQKRHPATEETLDALAKRPLLTLAEEIRLGAEKGQKSRHVISRVENEVYASFEAALKTTSTEKMWGFYINFCLQRYKAAKKVKNQKILYSKTVSLMQRAADNNCLTSEHYMQWLQLLCACHDDDQALLVSLTAVKKFPNVLALWHMCLTLHIQAKTESKMLYVLFNEALGAIPQEDSFLIWQLGVQWLSLRSPSKMTDFFETGVQQGCKEVCIPLKELYLEVSALREGIDAARNLYQRLIRLPPVSPKIYKKMIQIENAQLKPSIIHLRKYFEDAIREFGTSDVDLWLNFMQLETEHPDGDPTLYGMLYWKAMNALLPEYTDEFITRVTLYSTGHGLSTNF